MPLCFRFFASIFAALLVSTSALTAQSLLPLEPVQLDSFASFQPPAANWRIAGGIAGDPRREPALTATPGSGMLVNSPREGARGPLVTNWEHGDLELELEFLLPAGASSGIFLQGRYEVQLADSWSARELKPTDSGGVGDRAPRANASRAPGLWQRLHLVFEAPQFDAAGKKTRSARFARVALNGFVVQENVELTGPTPGALFADEKPLGPLALQGDQGPVALRGLAVKRLSAGKIVAENLTYKLYAGEFKLPGDYDALAPASTGTPTRFAHTAVEKSGPFALVFTGTLTVPRDGDYAFTIESGSRCRLLIDGRPVVVPLERGNQPGTIALTAGQHPFRVDMVQTTGARPTFELLAEGPGIAQHAVTVRNSPAGRGGNRPQILVEPKDRVLALRGFVPFEPRKRLYALSVGTPAGVHFAYDTETGGLLRAWRGSFLDTYEMWNARGEPQLAKPNGPALTFGGKPGIAVIESPQSGDWPTQPDPLWAAHGYTLEADGLPVFSAALAEVTVRDRFAPAADGRGLARTLTLDGKLPSWSVWVLLAEAEKITPQPGGVGWIVGDREWYLDWPADAAVTPVLRSVPGRQQLAVPVLGAQLGKPIRYTLVW